jgi:hypothetical protein
MSAITLVGALLLAAIHLFAGHMRFLHVIPRSRWLSMAGGASVAYVFLHLLPELQEAHGYVSENIHPSLSFIEHHIYLIALIGLAVFYGLERMVQTAPKQESERPGQVRASESIFWVHIGSFALYNTLFGYLLLHREETDAFNLILFIAAIGLHFLVNDYGLHEHHEESYARRGRWVLAFAILLGWLLGYLTKLPELFTLMLLAFIAGGVILNVLKEELPDQRQSRFWAFATGVTVYAILLLAVG